jgi:hypothetical protein
MPCYHLGARASRPRVTSCSRSAWDRRAQDRPTSVSSRLRPSSRPQAAPSRRQQRVSVTSLRWPVTSREFPLQACAGRSQAEKFRRSQRISVASSGAPSQAEKSRRKPRNSVTSLCRSATSREFSAQAAAGRHQPRISVTSLCRSGASSDAPLQAEKSRRKQRQAAASAEFPSQACAGLPQRRAVAGRGSPSRSVPGRRRRWASAATPARPSPAAVIGRKPDHLAGGDDLAS